MCAFSLFGKTSTGFHKVIRTSIETNSIYCIVIQKVWNSACSLIFHPNVEWLIENTCAIKTKLENALIRGHTNKFGLWIPYGSYLSQQEQRLKELAKKPHTSLTTAASPVSASAVGIMTASAIDMFSTPSSSNRYVENLKILL